MDEIYRLLGLYGLNEKETKVYVACLQLGQDTAYNIAEKSGVKRATTYLILRSLIKKSLVSPYITAKSYLYKATSPELLVAQLDHRKKEIEQSLPSLMALFNSQPDKPTIETFEGLDGVKQIYEEIIGYLKNGDEVLFYGDLTHFVDSPALLKTWQKLAASAQGRIREILNSSDMHKKYARDIASNKNPRHEIRMLASGKGQFMNDNAIYGDKLIIFSTQKHFFVTVIKSKEIADSYRTLFNTAWESQCFE